nr:mechanosensitive ion channel family protein [Oculatella sp. LEGE 06141]
MLKLIGQTIEIIPALLTAIVILVITRYSVPVIRRLVSAAAERVLKSVSLQSLLVQVTSVAIWVVGVLFASIILFPDLGLGDLIGFLGLGSVAVGFAFQDIFKNFLAGILLLINEPFRLNDQIIVDEYEGTVEAINVRSTEIRKYTGERVVIPNAVVFTNSVQVLTDRNCRRTDLEIGLDYNTPLARALQVLQTAMADVEGVLSTPSIEVDVVGFGDSSINFIVRYWTRPQMLHVRQVRTKVMLTLKQACDEADFNIPYPIRTLYFFDQQKYNDQSAIEASANSTQ